MYNLVEILKNTVVKDSETGHIINVVLESTEECLTRYFKYLNDREQLISERKT